MNENSAGPPQPQQPLNAKTVEGAWIVSKSKKTGRNYYFNTITGEAVWHLRETQLKKDSKLTCSEQEVHNVVPEVTGPEGHLKITKSIVNNPAVNQCYPYNANMLNMMNAYNPVAGMCPPSMPPHMVPPQLASTSAALPGQVVPPYNAAWPVPPHLMFAQMPPMFSSEISNQKTAIPLSERFTKINQTAKEETNYSPSEKVDESAAPSSTVVRNFELKKGPRTTGTQFDLRQVLLAKRKLHPEAPKPFPPADGNDSNTVPIFERSDSMIHKQMQSLKMTEGEHSQDEEVDDGRENAELVAQVNSKKVRFADNMETEHDIDHSDDNDQLWLSENKNILRVDAKLDLTSLKEITSCTDSDILFILADTNVFYCNLTFLDILINSDPQCKLLVVRRVHNEVHNAAMKRASGEQRARTAARFIAQQLAARTALTDAELLQSPGASLGCPDGDDEILNCCIRLVQLNIHFILLSNDKLLQRKTDIASIQTFTVKQLKNFLAYYQRRSKNIDVSSKPIIITFENGSSIESTANNSDESGDYNGTLTSHSHDGKDDTEDHNETYQRDLEEQADTYNNDDEQYGDNYNEEEGIDEETTDYVHDEDGNGEKAGDNNGYNYYDGAGRTKSYMLESHDIEEPLTETENNFYTDDYGDMQPNEFYISPGKIPMQTKRDRDIAEIRTKLLLHESQGLLKENFPSNRKLVRTQSVPVHLTTSNNDNIPSNQVLAKKQTDNQTLTNTPKKRAIRLKRRASVVKTLPMDSVPVSSEKKHFKWRRRRITETPMQNEDNNEVVPSKIDYIVACAGNAANTADIANTNLEQTQVTPKSPPKEPESDYEESIPEKLNLTNSLNQTVIEESPAFESVISNSRSKCRASVVKTLPMDSVPVSSEKKLFKWRRRRITETPIQNEDNHKVVPSKIGDMDACAANAADTADIANTNEQTEVTPKSPPKEPESDYEESIPEKSNFTNSLNQTVIEESPASESVISNSRSSVFSGKNISVKMISTMCHERKSKPLVVKSDDEFFKIQDPVMEERLKTGMEEWVSRYVQIMEEALTNILQRKEFKIAVAWPAPWSVHEATECLRRAYSDRPQVTRAAAELSSTLFSISDARGIIRKNVKPTEYMQMFSYGVYLLHSFMTEVANTEELQTSVQLLSALLEDIKTAPSDVMDTSAELVDNSNDVSEADTDDRLRALPIEPRSPDEDPSQTSLDKNSEETALKEKGLQQNVKFIRNFNIDDSFLKNFGLKKRQEEQELNAVEIPSADVECNRIDTNKHSPTTPEENTAGESEVNSFKPKIIMNFSKCAEFEEKLKRKENGMVDLHMLDYSEELDYDEMEDDNDLYEDYVDDEEEKDEYHEELNGIEELEDESNTANDQTETDSNNVEMFVKKFLREITETFLQIRAFCEQIFIELQEPDQLSTNKKNDLRQQTEDAHSLMTSLQKTLNSILDRESSGRDSNIQSILSKPGLFADISNTQLSTYRDIIDKCESQAKILLVALTSIRQMLIAI